MVRIPSYGPQTDQSQGENIQYYIILKHANVTTPLWFYLSFVFLEIKRVFFGNRLRELSSLVEQIIRDRFAKNEPINEKLGGVIYLALSEYTKQSQSCHKLGFL